MAVQNPIGWRQRLARVQGSSVRLDLASYQPALAEIERLDQALRALTDHELERRAYLSDVTYVTAKEAGFDYLRDHLATDARDLVHRAFHFALVDEADSLLIDEARSPLVIAGSVGRDASSARRLSELVNTLSPGVHFDLDEYGRDVELTEAGFEQIERALGCGNLQDERNYRLLTEANCALHARVLLGRDVDYIVRDGRIEVVDEFTGRTVPDRHWPDGLQAAIEAKEGLDRQADGQILGSITLQHFVREYPRLCGMTGTAQDGAAELREMYGLDVVVIPTHRPMIRADRPDRVFTHRDAKERALVDHISHVCAAGRPVLVGTLTIEESERLADRLRAAGVTCEVLNAKNDAAEARVVARAGAPGAVTISTNMAGRGTDIRLGGEDESERDRVAALGGLYVIGTNRHETRRVDLQLRGRAGRQGDPGESCFFISLEDDLMVRYGLKGLIAARYHAHQQEDAIENPIVRTEIARTQRIIEGQNFEIRRTLWHYAAVLERQRKKLMERRQAVLRGATCLNLWDRLPERRAALAAATSEESVSRALQLVTLGCIDRAWRDHLASCADLREGIHLVGLGGQDPLTRFTTDAIVAFDRLEETLDEAIVEALGRLDVPADGVDLASLGLKGPAATWTYIVNDDPFRNQIAMKLTGLGKNTIALYSALFAWPLMLPWLLIERFVRKRPARRS
jgi:preprotein translocase subunit SecA